MTKHKWILGVRNKLASIAMEMDSSAAIEGARMTESERKHCQDELRDLIKWIDQRLFPE